MDKQENPPVTPGAEDLRERLLRELREAEDGVIVIRDPDDPAAAPGIVTAIDDDGTPTVRKAHELRAQPRRGLLAQALDFDNRKTALDNFLARFSRAFIEVREARSLGPRPDAPEELRGSTLALGGDPPAPPTPAVWAALAPLGITEEGLQEAGQLARLAATGQTDPMALRIPTGHGQTIEIQAKVILQRGPGGETVPRVLPVRRAPDLKDPFLGYTPTPGERATLAREGQLGGIATLRDARGMAFTAYVGIDPDTNQLVATRTEAVRIADRYLGQRLSDRQKADLARGKRVRVEGMVAPRSQREFTGYLQVNAARGGVECILRPELSFRQRHQERRQREASQGQRAGAPRQAAGRRAQGPRV